MPCPHPQSGRRKCGDSAFSAGQKPGFNKAGSTLCRSIGTDRIIEKTIQACPGKDHRKPAARANERDLAPGLGRRRAGGDVGGRGGHGIRCRGSLGGLSVGGRRPAAGQRRRGSHGGARARPGEQRRLLARQCAGHSDALVSWHGGRLRSGRYPARSGQPKWQATVRHSQTG